jgi:hypothetical protein
MAFSFGRREAIMSSIVTLRSLFGVVRMEMMPVLLAPRLPQVEKNVATPGSLATIAAAAN